ncbi:MAG TPA: dUTP diphosphatase [Candidatus Limnocylindria bacterium]|nr:dUTP diphosphatase [Candidatus Limnocylindria bacterium]
MPIAIRRLDPDLPLPAYARPGDAGLDLCAAEDVTLPPGARVLVRTGIALAIPDGFAALVLPRSGLALRHGITVLNSPGLIDAGYRGEVKVLLVNTDGRAAVKLARGDRIAQLVVQRIEAAQLTEVDELPGSERGTGGFGSSGV